MQFSEYCGIFCSSLYIITLCLGFPKPAIRGLLFWRQEVNKLVPDTLFSQTAKGVRFSFVDLLQYELWTLLDNNCEPDFFAICHMHVLPNSFFLLGESKLHCTTVQSVPIFWDASLRITLKYFWDNLNLEKPPKCVHTN